MLRRSFQACAAERIVINGAKGKLNTKMEKKVLEEEKPTLTGSELESVIDLVTLSISKINLSNFGEHLKRKCFLKLL